MKKKVILPLLIVASILSGCNHNVRQNLSISNFQKTYKVSTWTINSDNSYVGSLQSQNTTFLWFKLPWRITNIYVKEWDIVKKWQLLATLDGNEIKTQYSSAKQMLASLWNMYKNTENMFNAQIASMKNKIAQAKAGMEWLKTWLGNTQEITDQQLSTIKKKIEQAKIWMETAKTNLDSTKLVLNQKERDIYSNSKNAIASTQILLNNFLTFTDQLFGISDANKHKNDAIKPYLSAKNTALKEKIKTDWRSLNNKYKIWSANTKQLLFDINNSTSVIKDDNLKNRIYENLQTAKKLLVSSRLLWKEVFQAVDSSVASRTFPQSMINQYKKQISTYQNNIESALLTAKWNYLMWIKWSIQNIENFNKQSKMQLDLLQKQYELAKAWYETAKQSYNQYTAMGKWNIDSVNTKYEVAKQQYQEALKGLQALKEQKQVQLSQIKSQIDQVKWNKNLAAVNLWNIKLYAPYNGVITKKIWNIWQVVWAGMPVLMIADYKKLKWVFYIPVEEVQNIKIWDKIIVKGLWKTTTWTISVIYPSANPISKKVQVEVQFKKTPKDWILWMFITWYPMNSKYSWLVVPYASINYKYWKSYILVKNKDQFQEKEIKLWKCNTNLCIVQNWLKLWDIIKQ